MMSKKNYTAIAQALKACEPEERRAKDTWIKIRMEIIGVLVKDNPRFKPERFLHESQNEIVKAKAS